ncbi:MAG: orotidine-5'-phosphate decarboxylase [Promethearchaeia archaeon]|nr:MAG: orotidine-5'-phosphate decarboxylase [Candidatus Lokiarchaeia archaeon]
MQKTFSEKLNSRIKQTQSIVCVGLDPRIGEKYCIPNFLLEESGNDYNAAIWQFNQRIIDATFEVASIFKPQIAFYEQYQALDALHKTIKHIHQKGGLVLLDAKRNDIGSTAAAYAKSVFEVFNADAVTVNGYLGIDGILPFMKYIPEGKGIFMLIKTSNPSSGDFQDLFSFAQPEISAETLEISDLSSLSSTNDSVKLVRNYVHMARLMKKWSEDPQLTQLDQPIDTYGFTNIGGVVGATYPTQLRAIRTEVPHNILLIPGYGAQGGKAEDIVYGVNDMGLGAIVNASRSIDFAYQMSPYREKFTVSEFDQAAKAAAEDMRDEIRSALIRSQKWNID